MKRGLTKYKTVVWEILQRDTGKNLIVQLAVSFVDLDVYLVVVEEYKTDEFTITLNSEGTVKSCGNKCVDFFDYSSPKVEAEGLSLLFGMNESQVAELLSGESNRNLIGRHGSGIDFYCNVNIKRKKFGETSVVIVKVQKVDQNLEVCFVANSEGIVESFSSEIFAKLFGYKIDANGKQLHSILTIEEDRDSYEEKADKDSNSPKRKRKKIFSEEKTEKFEWRDDGEHIIKYFSGFIKNVDGSNSPVSAEFYSIVTPQGEKKSIVKVHRILMKMSKYYGKWELGEKIGSGMGGKVISARHKESLKPAAIKVIKKRSLEEEEMYGRVKKESEIMMQLDHPNIIKLYEVLETQKELMIVMELVAGGQDLLKFVNRRTDFSENAARTIFKQILSAIDYCHSKSIFHRDIKHDNLLVNNEDVVKLIDFGLSRTIEQGTLGTTFCGTPAYSAPEMVLGKKYNGENIDVWSLGIVLYSLVSKGSFPFDSISEILVKEMFISDDWSTECKDLISKC
eukprot:TRINITY_DN4840_c0_g1_i4.p1 TRINITY_DN4840_c0_g1~~TRINITY_DN4840_c0_g1_i4.p1  ORF type:complete len:581 (+),score=165.09 TRINITY_DN4840_c0_g1_i4:218-1744(+)